MNQEGSAVLTEDENKKIVPLHIHGAAAYLNMVIVVQKVQERLAALYKTAGLSITQYGALRILRDSKESELTCRELSDRMVHRVPDITRLLDRLESRDLVKRQRSTDDRRVVRVWITEKGRELLAPLDEKLKALLLDEFGHMSEDSLLRLIYLLEKVRSGLT